MRTETTTETEPAAAAETTYDVLVVGAGLSGLYMLKTLRDNGFRARILEAGDGIGGTWFWNRYPGARVDVKSHDYSYSFDPDFEQEWEWTEKYPSQPELRAYVEHVADRYDLWGDIALDTRVAAARFDEATSTWTVRTEDGTELTAAYVVMATGCLSLPKLPEVPGVEAFGGATYHTASWPEEGVDFTGMRVAVIGTGSSGVQAIPLIAEQAADLVVYQRTPNYVLPARNHAMDPALDAEIKAVYRDRRAEARTTSFGTLGITPTHSALEVSEAERTERYDFVWYDEDNNLSDMLTSYTDMITDPDANDTAAQYVRDRIAEIVTDPETARKLTPTDHHFGTKRPCLGTDYYETFNRDSVHLVDVRDTPIEAVTEAGIRTTEGERPFDAIVFATGFDAMTGALTAIDIRGRDGHSLAETWAGGTRSYLGLQVSGFPNLFTVTGPGSPSVLSNMMVSIEQHVEWIRDCLLELRSRGARAIEATPEAEEQWTAHVDEVAHLTLYPQATSWYMGANVPGKPRRFMPYIGGVGAYREKCEQVAADGYEGFAIT